MMLLKYVFLVQSVSGILETRFKIGCFEEIAGSTEFPHTQEPRDSGLTPDTCIAYCKTLYYRFAALRDGTDCACGSTFGRSGRNLAISDVTDPCTTACPGDNTFTCGAIGKNNVYATRAGVVDDPDASVLCVGDRLYIDSALPSGFGLCSPSGRYRLDIDPSDGLRSYDVYTGENILHNPGATVMNLLYDGRLEIVSTTGPHLSDPSDVIMFLFTDRGQMEHRTADGTILISTFSAECVYVLRDVRYQGKITTTVNGLTCQRWDSQSPHDHDSTDADFPDKTMTAAQNYCRAADTTTGVWCYCTTGIRWEMCTVPFCLDGPPVYVSYKGQPASTEEVLRDRDVETCTTVETSQLPLIMTKGLAPDVNHVLVNVQGTFSCDDDAVSGYVLNEVYLSTSSSCPPAMKGKRCVKSAVSGGCSFTCQCLESMCAIFKLQVKTAAANFDICSVSAEYLDNI